jgi:hypothetical protein
MPEKLAYWRGSAIEVAFYPSDVLVRGKNKTTALTHGILAEELTHGPSLQTFDPAAQKLEKKIREAWAAYDRNPVAKRFSEPLMWRIEEIVRDLAALKVDYDEWQVLYREVLQLTRAFRGEPQVLQSLESEDRAGSR